MDRRIFFMLSKASRELIKGTDRHLTKHLGITTTQIGALFFLVKNDGCLLKEMSKGLTLNNSAVTGLVSRMEINGLVNREPCHKDGRAFRIFITEKGREMALKGFPMVNKFNEFITDRFTESEIGVIVRFLNQIVQAQVFEKERI